MTLPDIKITSVSSIWLHTSCGAIDYCYVIAVNRQSYWVGALSADQCVVIGANLNTEADAEAHMRKMVREMGGLALHTKGNVYTVLHTAALNTPWKWFKEGGK